jgi:cytochrome c biogenesis protein CcmG, thiol:disulfide interchange protein DsbE
MKHLVYLIIFLLATAICAESFNLGDMSPSFALYDLNGEMIYLTNILKNTPVIINFWNVSCAPCKEELPDLIKMAEKYKGKVTFIIINNDDRKKMPDKQKLKEIYKEDISLVISLFDLFGMVSKQFNLIEKDGKVNVPQTFVIDKEQKIRYTKKGKLSEKDFTNLEKTINDLFPK